MQCALSDPAADQSVPHNLLAGAVTDDLLMTGCLGELQPLATRLSIRQSRKLAFSSFSSRLRPMKTSLHWLSTDA
jgi:hypothetical protein